MKENTKLLEAHKPLFELNKIYEIQTPYDDYSEIDEDLKEEIKKLLVPPFLESIHDRFRNDFEPHSAQWEIWKRQELEDMSDFIFSTIQKNIIWSWKTKQNSTVFTKRLSQWLSSNYKINLDEGLKTEIGNIMTRTTKLGNKFKICYLDFDKTIGWEQGDFGDHGSCFWTNRKRKDVRSFLRRDPRIYALRLFKPYSILNPAMAKYLKVDSNHPLYESNSKTFYMQGYARCWILLDNHEGTPFSIIFNGYGLPLHEIGILLQVFLQTNQNEIRHKSIQLTDKGHTGGNLFIGNGLGDNHAGRGILMAPAHVLSKIAVYDIGLDERIAIIKPEPIPSFRDKLLSNDQWNNDNRTKEELLSEPSDARELRTLRTTIDLGPISLSSIH